MTHDKMTETLVKRLHAAGYHSRATVKGVLVSNRADQSICLIDLGVGTVRMGKDGSGSISPGALADLAEIIDTMMRDVAEERPAE